MTTSLTIKTLQAQAHSPVRNYVIPGLTSWLLGEKRADGSVTRMFEMTREQQECIAPHSHRFDFTATVLRGSVVNRIWHSGIRNDNRGCDEYSATLATYCGEIGSYKKEKLPNRWLAFDDCVFEAENTYKMRAEEIHSIFFSRDTLVLLEEGPPKSDSSIYLEPVCYGEVVPTFKVEPWMFKR